MNTDDLIAALAADAPTRPFDPRRVAGAVLATVAACTALFLSLAGPRPDLLAALGQPVVLAKTLLAGTTAALSLWLVLALARPGRPARAGLLLLVLPLAAAAALWLTGFATRAPDQRFADVTPAAVAECLGFILLLSILPAIVALRVLARGASPAPALSGALAGLAASAGAATGYSLFCTQDNPVFYVTWYGFAMLVVAAASALAGRRRLAW